MVSILIFGGTFDPIHNGHINTAINVQKQFHFERFIFLPCKKPLLKNASLASPKQRIEMLNLVLNEYQNYHFEIDAREIQRESPSYMVTTLGDYRCELGNAVSITLLMGIDTLIQLPQWYQWEKLLLLTNLLVINRPGQDAQNELSPAMSNTLLKHTTDDKMAICNSTHGLIYRFDAGSYDLASTSIRQQISNNNPTDLALPKSVVNYIKQNKLYR